jgi:two-component system, LytTR family, sensor kinase
MTTIRLPDKFVGMSKKYRLIFLHAGAWLLYLLIQALGFPNDFHLGYWITNAFWGLVPVIILFYLNSYVLLPRYLSSRRYIPLILWLIVLNIFAFLLRQVLVGIAQQHSVDYVINSIQSSVAFWNQFRVNLLFIGISFAYWYAQRNYKIEKDRQQLERDILNARLSALKNQINPHFLHNTLSFLYTRSLPHSAQLADAIARLSDMMRYSLGEGSQDGTVGLDKEVGHLENFIELHRLRFDNQISVQFNKEGNYSRHRIMPLLLITFVENAFKHGKLNDTDHPLLIDLYTDDRQIKFMVRNRKSSGVKERSNGIGLQNIRNRLELAYPGRHEFVIRDEPADFIVNLKLSLNYDPMYSRR